MVTRSESKNKTAKEGKQLEKHNQDKIDTEKSGEKEEYWFLP